MQQIHVRFLIAGLALCLFSAGGCAEGPKVVTDHDASANFSAFRTFAFSGITDRGHEVGASDSSPLRRRIKEMVHEQFASRGVQQVGMEERPDLLVHIFYGVKDLQRVQTTGNPNAKAYAYDEGNWVPVATTHETTYEDHEGTLILDLAESSDKKLVWRAVIRAVLGDNLEKNFELAHKGIAKAFERYPPEK
jgi:Domain of unknown function (DUF4136)